MPSEERQCRNIVGDEYPVSVVGDFNETLEIYSANEKYKWLRIDH